MSMQEPCDAAWNMENENNEGSLVEHTLASLNLW